MPPAPHHLRRRARAVVLALLLGVLATTALPGAPAASASSRGRPATPGTMSSHPWSTDGCSVVPDRGTTWLGWVPARYDFHHACVHHDGCYRGRWASRASCDRRFLDDLARSCRELHPRAEARRRACGFRGLVYYVGVRAFGASAYARGGSPPLAR